MAHGHPIVYTTMFWSTRDRGRLARKAGEKAAAAACMQKCIFYSLRACHGSDFQPYRHPCADAIRFRDLWAAPTLSLSVPRFSLGLTLTVSTGQYKYAVGDRQTQVSHLLCNMRGTLAFLSSLAAVSAVGVQAVTGTPAALPLFEPLFFGIFGPIVDAGRINNSAFGTRVYAPLIEGNFTDPLGNLVATVLPGSADNGIISDSGTYFSQVTLNLRWEVDQRLAYLRGEGVGTYFKSDLVYLHMETDSETYSALNNRFLFAQMSFEDATHAVITVFGAVSLD
ncbi:hypothetical protein C8T65DRAFT_648412 [Cerioporus squamosus]|nr:hypothetical protein C8T65DRAFT_648412 [Cerioporus squamosus]